MGEGGGREGGQGSGDLSSVEYLLPTSLHLCSGMSDKNGGQLSATFSEKHFCVYICVGLPLCLSGKESTCNSGDAGLIPGSGRSPGEGNGNPLQYSCLKNPMDREAWQATVHEVMSQT